MLFYMDSAFLNRKKPNRYASTTQISPAHQARDVRRPRKLHEINGPYSRVIDRGALGSINGRSREGRFLRAYERMLTEHCGGSPSVTQRVLISRTARLALHLELLDERALKEGRGLSATDTHFYITWTNALARHLDK